MATVENIKIRTAVVAMTEELDLQVNFPMIQLLQCDGAPYFLLRPNFIYSQSESQCDTRDTRLLLLLTYLIFRMDR